MTIDKSLIKCSCLLIVELKGSMIDHIHHAKHPGCCIPVVPDIQIIAADYTIYKKKAYPEFFTH
jgi:hypothetical protein